jgi:sugar lactone lactonase YvrE
LVTAQPVSQTNLAGTTVSFNVAVAGVGPFTYQWQFNGTNFPNNIITTVAGDGSATHAGDGGAATNAGLDQPAGVIFDAIGNLFIADTFNQRIRKLDTNGIITTVAGKGGAGYSGDGSAATNASLYSPFGVAFDAFGNLFIADHGNNRIREVNTNGIITTVAGKSSSGYSGDGGAATNSSLNSPIGVAFDAAGNLYIADEVNNRIRKVATNGIITTVAGKSGSSYSGDGGAATNASLNQPLGVALDGSGNLFIADLLNNRIRKVALFASYPTLTLNNVYPTNAGNYSVIITGPYGSITSSIVTLAVTVPPPIISQSVINSNHSVTLQLLTAPNLSSRILAATNLGSAVWLPIYTNVAGANGVWQFTDTNVVGRPAKFYRISTP